MNRMIRLAALLMFPGAVVLGDDLTPPSWRGGVGAAFCAWEFSNNQANIPPSPFVGPVDGARALVEPEPIMAIGWYNTSPDTGSQQGIWDLARGKITLSIPSSGHTNLEIRIQTTWLESIHAVPTISIPGGVRGAVEDVIVEQVPPLDRWKSRVENWTISSPPAHLTILVEGNATQGSQIDYIAVDMREAPVPLSPFEGWTVARGLDGSVGKEKGALDDPDRDGITNLMEFAIGGNPLDGASSPTLVGKMIDGFTVTIPVRVGTPDFAGSPSPSASTEGITYSVEGSAALDGFSLPVVSTVPVIDGLPQAPTGYHYRSFRFGGVQPAKAGFMRLRVTATP